MRLVGAGSVWAIMQQSEPSLAGERGGAARFLRQRPQFKRGHDLKKILLIAGLAALSWMSTYSGMLELVQANLGDLDLVFKVAIGASVAMLMLMVVWLLDQLFNENTSFTVRALYVAGYLFLTLISVGFSFGFYWKFLESRSEASRGAESAVTQVQGALHGAETRLDQMGTVFSQLALVSTQKAEEENAKGNSCPNSRPGDGPRRRLRESDAASFSTAQQFVEQRSAAIKKDVAALEGDLQKIVHQDKSTFDLKTGTRNEFIKGLGRKLEMTVVGFNAFRTDPQLKQLKADFAERADKTVFPDEQGKTFACPDPQIQAALRSAVKAIDALPVLEKPEITTVEGADATIEAFRRLNTTLLSLVQFKLPSTPDQIRSQQVRAVQTGGIEAKPVSEAEAGLSQRDYIPLAIALFVDLCLLLVSIPKPLTSSERTRRRRAQADGETYRTLDDMFAIHDDPDARAKMEPLRHIAFDYMGHDYVAIPLIAGREGAGGDHDGSARNLTEDDLLEAQFIANFFSSQESGGPFRRASFPPAPVVRGRLKQLGSKWAGIKSFRLYRFRKGAWSDFVMDMVVGADHELTPVREKQLEARIKKNEMKSSQIVFQSELMEIEHDAIKSAKRKEAELNTLMIETNISGKQQEADLRRREISAQSELSTLGLEASITAKRAEIERTKREISRTYESDLDEVKAGDRFELRVDGSAHRKSGFWDKIMGGKDEAHPGEPSFERKPGDERKNGAAAASPRSHAQAAQPSPDVAMLRQTVSELSVIMRELTSHQAAQVAMAAKTAAAGSAAAQDQNGYDHTSDVLKALHKTRGTNGFAHANGSASRDDLGSLRPGNGDAGHASFLDAGGPGNGMPRFAPDWSLRPERPANAEGASVILMPNLSSARQWNEAAASPLGDGTEPASQRRDPAVTEGYHANGNAALSQAYAANCAAVDTPQRPLENGPARRSEVFRWVAENDMAGGVHHIDRPIEPSVETAIQVDGERDLAPELEESWKDHHAPRPHLPDNGLSSPSEIDSFLTEAGATAEDMAEEFAEGPEGDWRAVDSRWQQAQQEALGGEDPSGDFEPEARPSGADRESIEIARIATRFGRSGTRRKPRT